MDIKLKNNHSRGIAMIMLVVILPAVIMVSLYPYFERKAEQFQVAPYGQERFINQLVESNYVLYMEELQRENGRKVSPAEVYMPGIQVELSGGSVAGIEFMDIESGIVEEDDRISEKTEYVNQMKDTLFHYYEIWEDQFYSLRKSLDYQVVDLLTGQVLDGNVPGKDIVSDELYEFIIKISYDIKGYPTVLVEKGIKADDIRILAENYSRKSPLSDSITSEYQYDENLSFHNPQNREYIYACTVGQVNTMALGTSYWVNEYYQSGMVGQIYFVMLLWVAVMALVIPCIKKLEIGSEKIFKAPLEPVLGIGIIVLSSTYSLVAMVAETNKGRMYQSFGEMDLIPGTSWILAVLWNLMTWAAVFLAVYWVVTCLRAVYTMGAKSYFKERCWTLRFIRWIKNAAASVYRWMQSIDLREPSNKIIFKITGINFLVLLIICSFWFIGIGALVIYSVFLFFILRKYYNDLQKKYNRLLKVTNEIAEGNLDVTIQEDLGVFEPFKEEIEKIQSGFKKAVVEEMKSQHLKTDLITNVSHDLKTPLTAIITYVNLLQDEGITPEERKNYIGVLDQKSMRLKGLIEDLFEISKATSQNVTLNLIDVDIVNLLKQVRLELSDKIEESGLEFRWNLPEDKIILALDSQKTYRIFENLLTNILKYAMPGTRVYIEIQKQNSKAIITMKNISAVELTFNPETMTERFSRGDMARNTEGSGLGLAIVKSFVELQKGELNLEAEADLFKVTICWPL